LLEERKVLATLESTPPCFYCIYKGLLDFFDVNKFFLYPVKVAL
jgi:hypothetical protein